MTPAVAAIPLMTSRLSIFRERFPLGQRGRTEQAARKPLIHPFEIENVQFGGMSSTSHLVGSAEACYEWDAIERDG
jgi:hypothetical protein